MAIKHHTLGLILLALLLNACATTNGPSQPEVRRMTAEALAERMPKAVATYTLTEIVTDSKQAKTPEAIIAKIKASDSRYDLSASKILELHQQGVDERVLNYIQQSNELAKQNYIADEINKAEKEKAAALQKLNQERLMQLRRYDPFWYPYASPAYRYHLRHWPRSRFHWGLGLGW